MMSCGDYGRPAPSSEPENSIRFARDARLMKVVLLKAIIISRSMETFTRRRNLIKRARLFSRAGTERLR